MKVNEIKNEIQDEKFEIKKKIAINMLKDKESKINYLKDKVAIFKAELESYQKQLDEAENDKAKFLKSEIEDIEVNDINSSVLEFCSFINNLNDQILW